MANLIGNPEQDGTFFPGKQSYPDTCAIRCQEMILEEFTGQDIPEDAMVQMAEQHGWYSPGGGTSPSDVGNLLELNGVPVTRYENATIMNLSAELAQGHKVIIGVESGDLWGESDITHDLQELMGMQTADHAVVVTGIDTSDPENVKVLLADPGTGQAVASYPVDQFMEAWQGSDFFMVATKEPAPQGTIGMEHFPYEEGHVDQFGSWSYDELTQMTSQVEEDSNIHEGIDDNEVSAAINAALEEVDRIIDMEALGEKGGDISESSTGDGGELSETHAMDSMVEEVDASLANMFGGTIQQVAVSNPALSLLQEFTNDLNAPVETEKDVTQQFALDPEIETEQDTDSIPEFAHAAEYDD